MLPHFEVVILSAQAYKKALQDWGAARAARDSLNAAILFLRKHDQESMYCPAAV